MKKEKNRKRVMFHNTPAMTKFNLVPDPCIGQKQDLGVILNAKMEIDVFHRGKWESLIESIDSQEQISTDGKVAGPKIAASFIFRDCICEAGQVPLRGDSAFEDTNLRVRHGGILICCNQVLIRDAVIIKKNEKLRSRVCRATIAIGRGPPSRSLYNLHGS